MWKWAIRAVGAGILGYISPRILIGLGFPIDQWAFALGEWLGLTWNTEIAFWAVAIVLGVVFLGIEAWTHLLERLQNRVLRILGVSRESEGSDFAEAVEAAAGPAVEAPSSSHSSDPAKRAAIDEIWPALERVEQAYESWAGMAGNWRKALGDGHSEGFAKRLVERRREMSGALRSLADLCEHKHGGIEDIYRFRMSKDFGGGQPFEAQNVFLDTISKLPPGPVDDAYLDLLEKDAESLQTAIGSFGRWARDSKDHFRKLRSQT